LRKQHKEELENTKENLIDMYEKRVSYANDENIQLGIQLESTNAKLKEKTVIQYHGFVLIDFSRLFMKHYVWRIRACRTRLIMRWLN